MSKFREYCQLNEGSSVVYNKGMDGPPLEPHTLNGAAVQIRQLAHNIRTTFNFDEKFKVYQRQIADAAKLLDDAATSLYNGIEQGHHHIPHKYYNPRGTK